MLKSKPAAASTPSIATSIRPIVSSTSAPSRSERSAGATHATTTTHTSASERAVSGTTTARISSE